MRASEYELIVAGEQRRGVVGHESARRRAVADCLTQRSGGDPCVPGKRQGLRRHDRLAEPQQIDEQLDGVAGAPGTAVHDPFGQRVKHPALSIKVSRCSAHEGDQAPLTGRVRTAAPRGAAALARALAIGNDAVLVSIHVDPCRR